MTSRARIILVAAMIGVVLVAVGGWYFFVRDDAPPPLTLESAVATTTGAPTPTATGGAPTTAAAASPTVPATSEPPATTSTVPTPSPTDPPDADGTWGIDPENTIVGYRIEEELAGIGGQTAVGRTSVVTGSLGLVGAEITAVMVTVDMTTLVSDDNRRDRQLRTRGLQTSEFPEAVFVLDEAIALGEVPAVGVPVSATAVGTLTLHGVSRTVEVLLEAQLTDSATIVVVGNTEVALADYDINPPTGFSVLSVADVGVFEFQLTFKAAT